MITRLMNTIKRRPTSTKQDAAGDRDRVELDVDHEKKTMTGRVYLRRPGSCPHSLAVRDEKTGVVVGSAGCTGEAGHPDPKHADSYGRIWK